MQKLDGRHHGFGALPAGRQLVLLVGRQMYPLRQSASLVQAIRHRARPKNGINAQTVRGSALHEATGLAGSQLFVAPPQPLRQ